MVTNIYNKAAAGVIFFTTLLIAPLLLTSCSDDFLERVPQHQLVEETAYSTDAAVLKNVDPLYNRAWFNFNRRAMLGMGSQRANDGWNPYMSAEFARFQLTGLTTDLGLAWSALYVVVSMSNSVLDAVQQYSTPNVSQAVRNQAMGEAYMMRGTAYFYLLRGWGEVIVYEDNIEGTQAPIRPLIKEEDVLRFIVRDYERAAELLPEKSLNGRPTRYAAKALLAKALLAQSGWNKGTRDETTLNRVISLCNEVIASGTFTLVDNYEDLFRPQYNDNSETILAMRWGDPLTGFWGALNATYSDIAFPEVTDVNAWGGSLYASVDMINYYNEEPADSIRLRATFFTPNRYYSYIKKAEGGYTYAHNWMQCKKGVVGTKADCDGHLAAMASPMNTYIMRYADVFLIKAEAILGNNVTTSDAQGLEAINTVRCRAKVKPLTSYSLETLIRERRIEFCMENANWFDMVTWYRWKPDYMLDFFNNKQYRGFEIRDGDVMLNEDGTLSYRCFPSGTWYMTDDKGHCYWNDHLAESVDDNTVVQTVKDGYVFPLDELFAESLNHGATKTQLSEANIFMPYPESDVLQNHYFREAPQSYNFEH